MSTTGVSTAHPFGGSETLGSTISNSFTNNSSQLGQKIGNAGGTLPGGINSFAPSVTLSALGVPPGLVQQSGRAAAFYSPGGAGSGTLLGQGIQQAENTATIAGGGTLSPAGGQTNNPPPITTSHPDNAATPAPLAGLAPSVNTTQEDALRASYLNALSPNYGMAFNNNAAGNQFTANPNIQKGK